MKNESKAELIGRFIEWFTPNPLFIKDLKESAEEFLDHEKLLEEDEEEYPDVINISWCTEDFESRAIDKETMADTTSEDEPTPIYDRRKFAFGLDRMKHFHDCNEGITWDTVDYFLDEYCKINPAIAE